MNASRWGGWRSVRDGQKQWDGKNSCRDTARPVTGFQNPASKGHSHLQGKKSWELLTPEWAGRYLDKRKLEKQKMLQKERFLAMEKGLPVPEWGAGMLDDEGTVISSAEAHERSKEKFRLASLCVGLILAFCGIGMMLAFHFSSDTGFHDIDTIGLIPLMAGIGLLLFYVLTRQAKP
jgi:hypothetical protein